MQAARSSSAHRREYVQIIGVSACCPSAASACEKRRIAKPASIPTKTRAHSASFGFQTIDHCTMPASAALNSIWAGGDPPPRVAMSSLRQIRVARLPRARAAIPQARHMPELQARATSLSRAQAASRKQQTRSPRYSDNVASSTQLTPASRQMRMSFLSSVNNVAPVLRASTM